MTLANGEIKFDLEPDEELTLEQLSQVSGGHDGGQYTMHFQPKGGDIIGDQAGYENGSLAPKRGSKIRL